jgi:hypothetical protein
MQIKHGRALIMKPMSKAELALEKRISKLEGQLASARYALNLMRNGSAEVYVPGAVRRITLFNGEKAVQKCSKRIPLFS